MFLAAGSVCGRKCLARSAARSGFTLLELLIAIAIIALLATLVVMVGSSAMQSARRAQVGVDIQDLAKGIAAFKQRFGVEPPSRISLYENPINTNNPDAAHDWSGDPRSVALIRQIWPNFDFTVAHDINNNGVAGERITLTGVECLVFFLGGMPDVAIAAGSPGAPGHAPLGFSQNPANPFALGGTNREKFMDFNVTRYVDIDGDGMMEYVDPLPGKSPTSNPYLYLSSYNGQGYDVANELPAGSPTATFVDIYRQGPNGATSASPSNPWNANSFQIISPGYDGQYGTGGQYDPNNTTTLSTADRDNITNFSSGVLAP